MTRRIMVTGGGVGLLGDPSIRAAIARAQEMEAVEVPAPSPSVSATSLQNETRQQRRARERTEKKAAFKQLKQQLRKDLKSGRP